MGSPPHTRGTPDEAVRLGAHWGITPAYAGNTYSVLDNGWIVEDHPRIRGEHFFASPHNVVLEGSPPHTRGTLPVLLSKSYISGITPAYAGNTLRSQGTCL